MRSPSTGRLIDPQLLAVGPLPSASQLPRASPPPTRTRAPARKLRLLRCAQVIRENYLPLSSASGIAASPVFQASAWVIRGSSDRFRQIGGAFMALHVRLTPDRCNPLNEIVAPLAKLFRRQQRSHGLPGKRPRQIGPWKASAETPFASERRNWRRSLRGTVRPLPRTISQPPIKES